jgi:hypothetical protein
MQTAIQVTTRSFGFTTPVSNGPGFRGWLNVVGRCAFDKDACGELTADLLASRQMDACGCAPETAKAV